MKETSRLYYSDLLRITATLAVIIIHCSGGWLVATPVGTATWHSLNFWDSMTRWAVPAFVMLSGMFFLDPKRPLSYRKLFSHSILRVVVALVGWGVVYTLWEHRADGVWVALKQLALGGSHYHLWFLYMLIGLYLISPILQAFTAGASRSQFHYFFLLAGLFTILIPFLLQLFPSQLASLYIGRIGVQMVGGYVCYYLAGYYLKVFDITPKVEWVIYFLGCIGLVATALGTFFRSSAVGEFDGMMYGYLSPNVAATAVAIFVFFRNHLAGKRPHPVVATLSTLSFGIYLSHHIFIYLLSHFNLVQVSLTPLLAIPLQATFIFVCSLLVSWLVHKIPVVGKYLT